MKSFWSLKEFVHLGLSYDTKIELTLNKSEKFRLRLYKSISCWRVLVYVAINWKSLEDNNIFQVPCRAAANWYVPGTYMSVVGL
jgi:hypothetical protein